MGYTREGKFLSAVRRADAIAEARAAGRMGATRLPDTVLFGHGADPTDTMIMACLHGLEEGQAERQKGLAA